MPEARWKRPALFITSIALGGAFGSMIWLFWEEQGGLWLMLLACALVLGAVFGVAVAIGGCSACVARYFGSA